MGSNFQKAVDASAGGTFLAGGGAGGSEKRYLGGVSLRAAAATATATVKEGTSGGRILAVLSAAANGADHFTPATPVEFTGQIDVTVTGAGAEVIVYEG